jgi:hypothetical protein
MNKFVLIDPRDCTVKLVALEDLSAGYDAVGLDRTNLDFTCIYKAPMERWSLNIIVDDLGMYRPIEQAKYWSLGGQLLEGGAIIFKAEEGGETSSMEMVPPVMFYRSHLEVEQAIARGEIARPQMSVNGEVVWRWPEARPGMVGG